jgi:hypothetical protein
VLLARYSAKGALAHDKKLEEVSAQAAAAKNKSELVKRKNANNDKSKTLDGKIKSAGEGDDTSKDQAAKSDLDDQIEAAEDQEKFFTWILEDKGFRNVVVAEGESGEDGGQRQDEIADSDTLSFLYKEVKSAGLLGKQQNIIYPFMNTAPSCPTDSIHWKAARAQLQPKNQPFNIKFHYTNFREPQASDNAHNTVSFPFLDKDGSRQSIDLTRQVYIIIEVSGGARDDFFIYFALNRRPLLFMKLKDDQDKQQVRFVSAFNVEIAKERLFSGKEMKVNVESAGGNLYIRNSLFGETPWIVSPRDIGRKEGIFIGTKIKIWSGNIQTGFSYAPTSYSSQGTMKLPAHGFEKQPQEGGISIANPEGNKPTISVSLKGAGSAEQEKTKEGDENSKNRQMVDSDTVTLEGESAPVDGNTVIDAIGGEKFKEELQRQITITQEQIRGKVNPNPDGFNFDQRVLGGFGGVS